MARSARPDAIYKPGILRLGTISALGVVAAGLMAGPGGLLHIRGVEMTASAATFRAPAPAPPTPKPPARSVARVAATTTTVARPATSPKASPVTATPTPKIAAPPTTPTTRPAPVVAPVRQAASAPAPAQAPVPAPAQSQAQAPASPATPARSLADPATSIGPSPQMQSYCFSTTNLSACNTAALAAIDTARAGEGLGPLQLPPGFDTLDPDTQVLTVINAERTSRGLPAFTYDASYQPAAQAGAEAGIDPLGPATNDWAAIYAAGYATALAADFGWMYDDGIGSPNVDCSASNTTGCWGHRDAILSPWAGVAAAASTLANGVVRMSALFVGP